MVGTTWECDLTGTQAAAKGWVVEDFDEVSPHEDTYEAWGNYPYYNLIDGELVLEDQNFCCQIEETSQDQIAAIHLLGGDFSDNLHFRHHDLASGTYDYNLMPTPAHSGADSTLTIKIVGGNAIDYIAGSNAGGPTETLEGNDGNDVIKGNGGYETIYGGADDDTLSANENGALIEGGFGGDDIRGGPHNDTLRGQAGWDTIVGGDGSDTIEGGGGTDKISGGAGDDDIDGGEDGDFLCGGTGTDIIDDGDPDAESTIVDQIWDAGYESDDLTCQDTSTLWGDSANVGSYSGCDTSNEIYSRPSGCP